MRQALFFILLFIAQTSFGQVSGYYDEIHGTTRDVRTRKNIDTCLLRVTYNFAHYKDTVSRNRFYDKTCLDVGDSTAKFYSYYAVMCDSLQSVFDRSAAARGGGWYQAVRVIKDSLNMDYKDWYFNYPSKGNLQTTRKVTMNSFYYDEPINNPVWEILSDTMSVLGYKCQKAVTNYYGRKWEAWFTFEIPYQMGPWKLHGLPGLVLKASTNDNLFAYTAIGIEVSKDSHIYHYNERFVKSNRKQMHKYEELMYSDPVGLRNSFGGAVIINFPDGAKKLEAGSIVLPYQPSLELD